MKSKSQIVLRALVLGQEIKLNNWPYPVFLSEDNNVYYKYTHDKDIICEISLNSFIKECSRLTEEQVFIIAANNGLKNLKGAQ